MRTDTDNKVCIGHVLRFTRAETDALPVEAGGSALRQDMPQISREMSDLLQRRPATLDDVRSIIFPSSLEASGDRPISPDASGPDSAESKASLPSASRPGLYAQNSPTDSQIATT
jgi:hypothetical protein